jgi:hypothetical protein
MVLILRKRALFLAGDGFVGGRGFEAGLKNLKALAEK